MAVVVVGPGISHRVCDEEPECLGSETLGQCFALSWDLWAESESRKMNS